MRVRSITILILGFFAVAGSVFGQAGFPFSEDYTYRDFNTHPLIWNIAQDQRGVLYMANNNGVLEFDGADWRLMETANPVRSLVVDKNNRVYVGLQGDIGRIEVDDNGRTFYKSLKDKLPEDLRDIGFVEFAFSVGDQIYFISDKQVMALDAGAEVADLRAWPVENLRGAGIANGKLYLNIRGEGLGVFKKGTVEFIAGAEQLEDAYVTSILTVEDKTLIATGGNGFFTLANDRVGNPDLGNRGFFADNGILRAIPYRNGQVAVATYSGGGVIMDTNGRILNRFTEAGGLPSNDCYAIYADHEGSLWLGHTEGLTHLLPQLPLISYENVEGISGKINAMEKHNGNLYLATINGVYRLREGGNARFEQVGNLLVGCWAIEEANGRLLVASTDGLFDITGGAATEVVPGEIALALYHSPSDPSTAYVGLNNGLVKLKFEGGRWKEAGRIEGITQEINSIVEKNGALWLGTNFEGTIKYNLNNESVTALGASAGLTDGFVRVAALGDKLLFVTSEGIYTTEAGNNFQRDDALSQKLGDKSTEFVQAATGEIWIYSPDGVFQAVPAEGGGFAIDSNSIANLVEERISVVFPTEDYIWLAFQDNLFRIDAEQFAGSGEAEFAVLLRGVQAAGDSLLFGGATFADGVLVGAQQEEVSELEYAQNSLTFQFSATSFLNAGKNTYQYKLEGFDKGWSDWTTRTQVSYTNLPEGDYTFKVRARNSTGQTSEVSTYHLVIAPPWYRTIWAYILYVVGAGVLVFLIIRFNARRLEAQNKRLEEQVQERTAEVKQRQQELLEEHKKLTEANNNLEKAYRELSETQDQLVQSEKMAALGQLIAGVAHEINTPIGAINASVSNLSESLPDTLEHFPELFEDLSPEMKQQFFKLVDRTTASNKKSLTSREERKYRKQLAEDLENHYGIKNAKSVARGLVKVGIYQDLDEFADLFNSDQAPEMIEMASRVGKLHFNLSNISLAVSKTQKIVFALKNYSRRSADGTPDKVSLTENIDTVLTIYHNQLKQGVEVDTNYEEGIPDIDCFPDQLNQVWTNIIHNAIQAMNSEGKITIDVERTGENRVQVRISDTGPGIPEEIRQKIFDPFFTTKKQGEGSGLGLDIVRKIVETHQGEISVDSEPGRTTFIVDLPIEMEVAEADAGEEKAETV